MTSLEVKSWEFDRPDRKVLFLDVVAESCRVFVARSSAQRSSDLQSVGSFELHRLGVDDVWRLERSWDVDEFPIGGSHRAVSVSAHESDCDVPNCLFSSEVGGRTKAIALRGGGEFSKVDATKPPGASYHTWIATAGVPWGAHFVLPAAAKEAGQRVRWIAMSRASFGRGAARLSIDCFDLEMDLLRRVDTGLLNYNSTLRGLLFVDEENNVLCSVYRERVGAHNKQAVVWPVRWRPVEAGAERCLVLGETDREHATFQSLTLRRVLYYNGARAHFLRWHAPRREYWEFVLPSPSFDAWSWCRNPLGDYWNCPKKGALEFMDEEPLEEMYPVRLCGTCRSSPDDPHVLWNVPAAHRTSERLGSFSVGLIRRFRRVGNTPATLADGCVENYAGSVLRALPDEDSQRRLLAALQKLLSGAPQTCAYVAAQPIK